MSIFRKFIQFDRLDTNLIREFFYTQNINLIINNYA